ncbi:serine/arginine repetitive matrix protein 5 isoform X1 [Colias croceus]|uniref:serine/arginine repetitive matrix protein 5 isoform X1 n=1 Tax=Colias crocea TaxID=72248 RepID=UPI001E279F3C|nr:serine/arginine repetitive matrix protein 5 isoform X1 [Colias croceus]XP_045497953.1 serine/arginine repetitive matrix protein 5 isoform X1 [Colias croceus]XP_045497954.1 serine/arginine repetitive matrix protein 5 isoform X1 [Colias croceus]
MVTVFTLSEHGAIKRRPRVLLQYTTKSPERSSYNEFSLGYSAEPGETIATTKEEEWVTRKTSEVTTTRQIATRVKRELVLEDGRILKDSGPKISTSVNEDTHTTNFQQTEHRVPEEQKENASIAGEKSPDALDAPDGIISPVDAKVLVSSKVVANPDGKVRESHERKVLTRNVTERVRETEERIHTGDTTHEALIAAVNETKEEDIRDALRNQTEQQLALVPRGPTLVKDTVAYNTTITTDDTEELRALRPDGTIVTETRHTKEQERVCDEELGREEAGSLKSDESLVEESGGKERRKRIEVERSTELMAGGLRVGTQVHSRTRTEEAEREGQPNMDDDWDSLSVRMRRQRRLRLNDQDKDYAKRPINFDIEEETRKKETSKWLESHFGSDSRSSHDSIAEEIGRRPETGYYVKKPEDEGYYGKTSSVPAPPVYPDRVLRKTKSSTPSDERPVNRTGGYFKGVADWSQRRATKPRMPEPRSSSPSPPAARSPYASDDRLNGSSPRHVYGKRDSPQGRSSPIGRRHPPSRDDSAYVSSSTMHSPPRGSPFRPLETDRSFREPSIEDDYRPPIVPERKRHSKQRSEDHRYDSGYRSSSRNENSARSRDSREDSAVEPPPDYSPPRERRGSSDRDRTPPRRRDRDERKQNQKTRFADNGRRPSPVRKSVGSAIGNSIRKLVGKIRSASSERKTRWRTPSPEHASRTYRQYGGELAPPAAPHAPHSAPHSAPHPAPPHRYYLGEDPFAPSIYGREHKYDGSPRRAAAADARDRERGQFSSTLGRFSHSASRLNPNSETEEDYSRSAQTLPRKLHDRKEKTTEKPSSNKYWQRLTSNKRSTSAINISNNGAPEGKVNGYPPGPAKPARTYKGLNRSKSFAMGVPEQETHPRYVTGMNRNYSTMYKSNPHLSRLDETPEQLKSPGIVSIINRSQRDLADAVSRETERRRDGLFGARYGKTTPLSNGHTNGFSKSYDETDKKKIFLKGLKDRAPELYQTLHDDESDGSRLSSRYGTPSPHYKDRISEERKVPVYRTDSSNRDSSPFVSRLDTRIKTPANRRESNSSDNYSETYRYQTRSGDPERPSVTDTVETISKKIVPSRDGRSKEIIESREVNSVTKSRGYKAEPITTIKYYENDRPLKYESRNGAAPLYTERRRSNYKVSEKVRDY